MAVINIDVLKSKFESGDIPTQQDFTDLVDTLHDTVSPLVVQTDEAGILTVTNTILPSTTSTIDIGSSTARFKTIYVDEAKLSANTLYIGDTAVLGTDDETILVKADPDQSIAIKTTGLGETSLSSTSGVNIETSGLTADVSIQTLGAGAVSKIASANSVRLIAPTVTTEGASTITGNQNVGGNLTVTGNLTVNGTQTTVNSTTVSTADNIITLNKGEVGTGVTSGVAGIQIDRGEAADYQIVFNETDDMFQVGMVGNLETIASQNYVTANSAPVSHVGAIGSAHGVATTTVNGFMTATDKTKLDGVAAGAQVNTVTSVASKTGAVSLVKADVGLSLVDNTSDAAKPVSTATQTALDLKANLASPTFTGTVGGITKAMVELGYVDNTADIDKPVSTATQTALNLKANADSPAFTGTVTGITKAMVGLGYVDNTADVDKPVSIATQTAIDLKANVNSPTFTGTVSGITKTMVGLSSVDNTADVDKPISLLAQTALNLKAPINSPTFTGTVSGITKTMVGLSSVDNTADAAKNVLSATKLTTSRTINGVAFDGTSDIVITAADAVNMIPASEKGVANGVATLDASGLIPSGQLPSYVDDVIEATTLSSFPASGETSKIYVALDTNKTYRWSGSAYVYITSGAVDSVAGKTGVVTLVKADVGLGSVDNTSDAAKPVSTATQTALNLKANLASPTFTGTVVLPVTTSVGTVTSNEIGYLSGVTSAIQTQIGSKAPLASPAFTGTVTGITKTMVGLGSVDNTADLAKPVSTATQTALNLKANLASPTFTGTVVGITKAMVGLDLVDNTSDAAKPISTAAQTALNLKANLASPTFTGTVVLPSTTSIGLVTSTEFGYLDGVTSSVQTQLNSKAPLASPTFTGTVSGITKAMVGLDQVDNTSDASKPVSTATQTALDLKANLASPTFTGTVVLPSTTSIGLVSNTELGYLNGVTSAIQTQINTKAALASPTFTGTPIVPTAVAGTNTTQAASTAFVNTAIINSGALVPYDSIQVANFTAVAGNSYFISGAITVTLPASPTLNKMVEIIPVDGGTGAVIARNGSNIMGAADDLAIDNPMSVIKLRYSDATNGWRLV